MQLRNKIFTVSLIASVLLLASCNLVNAQELWTEGQLTVRIPVNEYMVLQKRSEPEAPIVEWLTPGTRISVCEPILLKPTIKTVHSNLSVRFIVKWVDETSGDMQDKEFWLDNPPWELTWDLPCDGIPHHNYLVKVEVVDGDGRWTVSNHWIFLRPAP